MRIFTFLIIISIFLCAVTGCMLPREEELLPPDLLQPEEVRFRTIEVERGSIQDVLEGYVITGSSVHYDMTFHNRSGFLVELEVRQGQKVSEGDVLARLDTDSLEIDIQRQNIEVEKLKLMLEETIRSGGSRYARRYAELNLEMAELMLFQLEDELAKSTIIAPVDGEVVFLGAFKIGEFVPGRSIVMTIADPAHIQFEYNGTQIGRIKHGMEVEVMIGSRSIPARVSMIPANAPAEDRDRYRNLVIFMPDDPENLSGRIDLGSRFDFSIFMEEKHDVIVVPVSALSNFLGQNFAHVLDNGMRTERDLDIGIVSGSYVEVLRGLEEGELLIVGVDR